MKTAWIYRLVSAFWLIIVLATEFFVEEDIFTTFETVILFLIVIGTNGISVAIEENKS